MSQWYDEYLKSDHWQRTRLRKLLTAELSNEFNVIRCQDSRCRMWFPMGYIHVHHKTYKRIWKERLSDLEVLCLACHHYRHGSPREHWWLELKRQNAQVITRQAVRYGRSLVHVNQVMVECLDKIVRRQWKLTSQFR